jgi:hypothetical protein
MEVMGLMLGEFVDEYTVRVIDVFAMPQSGTVTECLIQFKGLVGLLVVGHRNVKLWFRTDCFSMSLKP